jgi:anti-sigma-K factor RskA
MICEELRPDYTSYALGIADDPERAEIAEHLARRCPDCMRGMASALATVTAMSGAVELTEPPARLRRRVMAAVESAPRRSWAGIVVPWAITAAMSIALVAIGLSGRRQLGDTPKLQQALTILNDPATRDATFGATGTASRGRVFVNPSKGVVFIGANLPRLDAGRTFELWVIPAKGNPIPDGLFRSQSDATAVFVWPGPVENATAVEVTVEPLGGSAQPTAKPIVSLPIVAVKP